MTKRKLKVYEAPGEKCNVPRINLQGSWLSNCGFQVGDHITVTCQDNRIIVEPATDSTSELINSN